MSGFDSHLVLRAYDEYKNLIGKNDKDEDGDDDGEKTSQRNFSVIPWSSSKFKGLSFSKL